MNYDKLYKMAERLKPGFGKDLVHHSVILASGKKLKYPETYIYRIMITEARRPHSSFNKQYFSKNTESIEKELPVFDSPSDEINDRVLQIVIQEISDEYPMEMDVFRECVASSINNVSQKVGIHFLTIEKIYTFVKNEIRNRYDILHNSDTFCFSDFV